MVTNEPVSRSLSVKETRPPVEFVTTIENVTFAFVSLDETGTVNVAVPPLVVVIRVKCFPKYSSSKVAKIIAVCLESKSYRVLL